MADTRSQLPTGLAFTAHNALPEDVQEMLMRQHNAARAIAEYLVRDERVTREQDVILAIATAALERIAGKRGSVVIETPRAIAIEALTQMGGK